MVLMNVFDIKKVLESDEIIDIKFLYDIQDLFDDNSYELDNHELLFNVNINCLKLMYLIFRIDLINNEFDGLLELDLINNILVVDESILRENNLDYSLSDVFNKIESDVLDVNLFVNYICNSSFKNINCIDLQYYNYVDDKGFVFLDSLCSLSDVDGKEFYEYVVMDDNLVYYEDKSYDIGKSVFGGKFRNLVYIV